LGALAGIENTIGRIETPTRHLIETAADRIEPRITCFTSVCSRNRTGDLQTHALFGGDPRVSVRKAAEVSREVHIKYTGRKYRRVVALLDEHYDELWTGGKASYKLGGIIEEGGELIIFAPHLRCASVTHGKTIEKYGYAPIERVKEMVAESEDLRSNLCVAAHLAHVAYAGTSGSGGKTPLYKITIASKIDRETCQRLNLEYLDPTQFSVAEYHDDPDCLIVERAGQDLYLVEPLS
jgi:nickel-dependent lactate racemase